MSGFRALTLAAWAIFLINAAGVAWLAINGWLTDDALGRSIALGVATLFAAPLAVLLVVLALCTRRHNSVGLWICLALGLIPVVMALINIARHQGTRDTAMAPFDHPVVIAGRR